MQGSIQSQLESMERSALTQVDGAQHHRSCCWAASPSPSSRAAPTLACKNGGQWEPRGSKRATEGPSAPKPGGHEAACKTAACPFPHHGTQSLYPPQHGSSASAQCCIRQQQQPCTAAPWERVVLGHCILQQQPCTYQQRGSQQHGAWRVPNPEQHTLLPAGQTLCMSPETHTLLWGLCLNSLQMQKDSAGCIHTGTRSSSSLLHQPWLLFTPLFLLRQPISLLFLLSSFPRSCAALPRIPCATQQPALLHSSESLLLSHHFFGICWSQRSKNLNGEIPALGPSPLNSLWYWYRAHRRQYQAKGGSIHACNSPQLGAFYSITAIKNCPFKSFVLEISILAAQVQIYWWEQLHEE